MILDSNIVIEAVNADERPLRELVERYLPSVSSITLVEVLGFPRLTEEDRRDLEGFFALATILPISDEVIDRAIALRQQRKMGLGDALIAATALVHGLTLVTRNVKDFRWIEGLDLLDPSAIGPAEGEGHEAGE
jgi:predicted nucleic acid-binding protein